ncbi:hypothetical protein [Desertivirga brevis]|uniref:hypothetical protein n=1 Tax=Desertivirga brevis TaxID=2810310 RepID=UPI001A96EF62|nr:hypothetical protein [Pedobacter sp. SYSU D00873]
MGRLILALFFMILFTSCALKKKSATDIEFRIVDRTIKEDLPVTLKISNKTRTNYYFPVITSLNSEKWRYMLSADENRFFFLHPICFDFKENERYWSSDNCFAEHKVDSELVLLNQLWEEKKQKIEPKDLILIKSGQSVNISVPISAALKITENCSWELQKDRGEKCLKLAINYFAKNEEVVNKFLNMEVIEALKKMGFELYSKEINSNRRRLLLK